MWHWLSIRKTRITLLENKSARESQKEGKPGGRRTGTRKEKGG
jgi:hypothetical protein